MSTTLYLDQNDTISNAIDKVLKHVAQHLVIVMPTDLPHWHNNLSFSLLFETMKDNNKTAVVVSINDSSAELARKAGFTVVASVDEAIKIPAPQVQPQKSEHSEKDEKEVSEAKADSLGFVENQDIAELIPEETEEPAEEKNVKEESVISTKTVADDMPTVILDETPIKKAKKGKPSIFKKSIFWVVAFFILVVAGTTAFMLLYLPKATVELYIEGQTLSKQLEVSANPNALEPNSETKVIPAILLTVEESGQKTVAATGSKSVGQPATGTVTIQNWTDSLMVFPAGTLLTVSSSQEGAGLTFATSQSVTVPPQTFSIPEEGQKLYEAGTEDVTITASAIGTAGNLKANTNFAVGQTDYSSFKGINASAFTGGSSQTVKIVSQEDRNNLLTELAEELYEKGKTDLASQRIGDQAYDESLIDNTLTQTTFSREAGAEAAEITLSANSKSEVLVYSQSQLKGIFQYYLAQNAPQGYKMTDAAITVSVTGIEKSTTGMTISATGGAVILPEIETEKLAASLLGLKPAQAEAKLKEAENIIGFKIELWPPLPQALQSMPNRQDRLIIKLVQKDGISGN